MHQFHQHPASTSKLKLKLQIHGSRQSSSRCSQGCISKNLQKHNMLIQLFRSSSVFDNIVAKAIEPRWLPHTNQHPAQRIRVWDSFVPREMSKMGHRPRFASFQTPVCPWRHLPHEDQKLASEKMFLLYSSIKIIVCVVLFSAKFESKKATHYNKCQVPSRYILDMIYDLYIYIYMTCVCIWCALRIRLPALYRLQSCQRGKLNSSHCRPRDESHWESNTLICWAYLRPKPSTGNVDL